MDELDIYKRVTLALAIGFVIGLERGWHTRAESGGLRVAGVRSFTLVALLGALAGILSEIAGDLLIGAVLLPVAALIVTAYVVRLRVDKDYGITTEVAALVTFALGALAVRGDMIVTGAAGIVTAAVLAAKPVLHRWIKLISQHELGAGIQLLVISVVILPLLPDRGFGPGQVLNPYELWWIVVLIAALSFVGYLAVRLIGPRAGILLTGLFGGLVSSVGVALTFSRMGRREPAMQPVLAAGVLIASSVMFFRVLLVVGILNWQLVPRLAWPMVAMAAAGLAAAALGYRFRKPAAAPELADLPNPLELVMALQFAAILAAVVLLSELVRAWMGDPGIYLVAALAGATDADAVAVSAARQARQDVAAAVATAAITIAAFANTAAKGVIVAVLCGGAMARRVGLAMVAVVAVGAAALAVAGALF